MGIKQYKIYTRNTVSLYTQFYFIMITKKRLILVGLLLMVGGLVAATLTIDTTWHYFGTGVEFGIGAMLLIIGITRKNNE